MKINPVWILASIMALIACIALFIPYEYVQQNYGVSFPVFFGIICLIELVTAVVIVIFLQRQKTKHEENRKEKDGDWRYYPDEM